MTCPRCYAPRSGPLCLGCGFPFPPQPAPTVSAPPPLPRRSEPQFDGDTYDPALDADRLSKQIGRVYDCLWRATAWLTLAEIAQATGDPEASVSARLRDLRKPRFGAHRVEARRRNGSGLWEYLLVRDGR